MFSPQKDSLRRWLLLCWLKKVSEEAVMERYPFGDILDGYWRGGR